MASATLIQRFESKRGLLLALAKVAAEGSADCFTKMRALFASFRETAQFAQTPEILANNLGFLQMDLTDPEFRHWTLISSRATMAGYRELLEDAIRAGELLRCDTEGLPRLIPAVAHGSMVAWAFHDLEMLLKAVPSV